MSKTNWNVTDDAQFEALLSQNLPDTPPTGIVEDVTPWRRAINRILVGLLLCAVNIAFLKLEYILPLIGMFLILLGFRTLRKENGYLCACWIMTAIRFAIHYFVLISNGTVYHMTLKELPIIRGISITGAVLLVVTAFCFWLGLRALRKKSGVSFKTSAAGAFVWWHSAIFGIALFEVTSLALVLIAVALFFLFLYLVYKQSYELDEAGYVVSAAPVRISDRRLVSVLLAVLLVGLGCAYTIGGKYPMQWQTIETKAQIMAEEQMNIQEPLYADAEVVDIKRMLLALGAPERILNDMTVEDILACQGARQVVVYPKDDVVWEEQELYEEDVKNALHIQSFGVELENNRWKMIHHFSWDGAPGFAGVDAICLQKGFNRSYVEHSWYWNQLSDYTGRVLYDKNGKTLWAPYYFLEDKTYTSGIPFWEGESLTEGVATFSFPRNAQNARGYFCYDVERLHEDGGFNVIVDYMHQQNKLQYPVYTADEWRNLGLSWSRREYIWMKQEYFQFFTNEDGMIETP